MEKLRKNIRENKVIILIITIVILLILAGISIVELTGIFEKGLNKQMLADYESQLNNLGKSTVGSGDVTGGSGEYSSEDNEQGDQPPATQGQSASDIANVEDKSEVYGKQVTNYIVEGATDVKWDIFYADTENIYLIADDYIERSLLPEKNGKKPNNGKNIYQRTAYITSDIVASYKRI